MSASASKPAHGFAKLAIVALAIAAFGFVGTGVAQAVLNNDPLELDGNAVSNGGQDWSTVFGFASSPGGPSPSAKVFVTDGTGNTDDTFTTGGSKDIGDVSSWQWVVGSAQDKDDLTHAFAASYNKPCTANVNQTCQYLYFGADRFAQNGDASLGFWFFHNPVAKLATTPGTFSGIHTVGDLLVLSDFTNGGSQPTIKVYKWVGSGGSDGAIDLIKPGVPCNAVTPDPDVCGMVNTGTIDSPWSYLAKGNGAVANKIPPGGFFEAGINASALSVDFDPCLSSFLAETRASQTASSTLSDFALGKFTTCGVTVQLSPSAATNEVGQSHTITATATINTGSGFGPYANATVNLTASGPAAGSIPATCTTNGSGQCSFTFTSSSVGTTTVNATVSALINNKTYSATTVGGTGADGPAAKHWVDASIAVGPTAHNDIGAGQTSHIFTITVTALPDSAGAPTFGAITYALTGSTPATTASTCGAPSGTGNTRTCTVSITSTTPGDAFTINASASVTMGGVTVSRSTSGNAGPGGTGAATKDFNCLTHPLTLTVSGAGKSPTALANFLNDTWTIAFEYNIGSGYVAMPAATRIGTTFPLNYTTTANVPTPNSPYSASATWHFMVKQGATTMLDSGALGPVALPNSGDCKADDNAVSPVSTPQVKKVNDAAGDGNVTTSSPGLSGWTITATPSSGDPIVVTTNLFGTNTLTLDDLLSWTICETQQTNWFQTYPPASSVALSTNADRCYTLAVGGAAPPTYLFGNTHLTSSLTTTLKDAQGNTITTAQPLGTNVHDTATVTGSPVSQILPKPTGTVTFSFFKTGDCSGDVFASSQHSVDGPTGVSDGSASTGALHPGNYSFSGSYASDNGYVGNTSACEPFSVNQGSTTTATQLKNGQADLANGSSVALGSVIHDTASVTGVPPAFSPTGTITFTFYSAAACGGDGVAGTAVDIAGATSADTSALHPGSYGFKASYSGDSNYTGSTSACEPFSVDQGRLAISTVVYQGTTALANPGALAAGTTPIVHDTATATATPTAFTPTGAITFKFFNNGTCANTPTGTPAATQDGLTAFSADSASLGAGTYSYLASIAGDTNYIGADAACESFTVTTLTINKQVNPAGGPTFSFAVTGGINSTVNVATSGTPGTGSTTVVIDALTTNVTENAQTGYLLTAFNCGGPSTLGTATFTPTAGTNTNCFAENQIVNKLATRTQGFWATHTKFTDKYWNDLVSAQYKAVATWNNTNCTTALHTGTGTGVAGPITSAATLNGNQVMGGFYANNSQLANGTKRNSSLDSNRIKLLQQLFAAILNNQVLGADDGGKIATAITAYCGTDASAIQKQIGILDTFNQSGDNIAITNYTPGNATPQDSRKWADIGYWDVTK